MTTTISPAIIEQLSTEPGPILVWRNRCTATRYASDGFVRPHGAPSGRCLHCYASKETVALACDYFNLACDPYQATLESCLREAKAMNKDWLLFIDGWRVVDKWRVQ